MAVSISGKQWQIPADVSVNNELLQAANNCLILAKLLFKRGISNASLAKSFLNPLEYIQTSPIELPDIAKAIVRVSQAIAQEEHITVYGDYDVDGVSGAAVLITTLRKLGADVDYYIPSRTNEGYGLNLKAISILASKRRTKLIITCDCGVSNFAEVNFAKSLGVDTIITDHHTMPEFLPPALATLHPKLLPENHHLYNLSGVGVAYKLCEALLLDKGVPEEAEELLDLVVLGMIADMVPLIDDSRYLVQVGMSKLANTKRPGLRALIDLVSTNGNQDLIGFGLAPRINAVGRLSDANLAVELMTTDDPIIAEKLSSQLQVENRRRQEITERIFFEAEQMITDRPELIAGKAIAIYKEDWHHGVVGIVASRLVEKYHRPVFIGELNVEEGLVKGSARGIGGIDLYEVLKANEHLISRFGGHKMAAGFTVEKDKAKAFCQAIVDTCNNILNADDLKPILELDLVVEPNELSMDLVKSIMQMAPFGMGNKKPLFMMKSLACASVRSLGKAGKHSRIVLAEPGKNTTFECVMWNSRNKTPAEGQILDVAFSVEINSFNGRDRLQLVLVDWIGEEGKSTNLNLQNKSITNETPHVAPERKEKVLAETKSTHINLTWKDLRNYENPGEVLHAAYRNLKSELTIFSETLPQISSAMPFADRANISQCKHLMLWQFPPSEQVLKKIIAQSSATTIYLVGNYSDRIEDGSAFLRRLLGFVRFAVNKKEGKADPGKLICALGTTKMTMALGLAVLQKLELIDWFAEEGCLYLKLLGQNSNSPESLPEFRQLTNSLKEIHEFRKWCAESSLKAIQLAIVPNSINISPGARRQQVDEFAKIPLTSTQTS